MVVRAASESDMAALATMLSTYMAEAMARAWAGSVAALQRDGLGREFYTHIAFASDKQIGFACWHRIYNVHYCVPGGEVTDMFVEPAFRNRGVALLLVAAVAKQVQSLGGQFLRGRSDPQLERLYKRFAVIVPGAECYLGGPTFESLAMLSARPLREIVRALPG
jgi:GNAT superfamily N-acetyltransferase